jgi:hypothetical protein
VTAVVLQPIRDWMRRWRTNQGSRSTRFVQIVFQRNELRLWLESRQGFKCGNKHKKPPLMRFQMPCTLRRSNELYDYRTGGKCFSPDVYYFDIPYDAYDFTSISVINIKDAVESVSGDIYLLNNKHRVMCGDSTNANDVSLLMDGKKN